MGHSPEVASVCGIFDVVTDIGEHLLGRGTVPCIKYLRQQKAEKACVGVIRKPLGARGGSPQNLHAPSDSGDSLQTIFSHSSPLRGGLSGLDG